MTPASAGRRRRRRALGTRRHRQPRPASSPTACSPRSSSAAPTRSGGRSSSAAATNDDPRPRPAAAAGRQLPRERGEGARRPSRFWLALGNSIIVSARHHASRSCSFSTLAGYAFAKLRFRGRDGLLVFVDRDAWPIPTQLGIIPLFIADARARLDRHARRGHRADARHARSACSSCASTCVDVIPDELIEAARVDGANQFRTFLHRRPARRPTGHGDARPVHVHDGLDRLPLAAHRARPAATRPCRRRSQPAAVGLLRRLLDRARRRGARRPSRCSSSSSSRASSSSRGIMQGAVKGMNHRPTTTPDRALARADFLWGAATAAAQIEGAAHEDGKDDSIWDASPASPAPSPSGDTPERACRPLPPDAATTSRS